MCAGALKPGAGWECVGGQGAANACGRRSDGCPDAVDNVPSKRRRFREKSMSQLPRGPRFCESKRRPRKSHDRGCLGPQLTRARMSKGAILDGPFDASSDSDDGPMSTAETAFHERKEAVMVRLGALNSCLVRGVDGDKKRPYTEEDLACIRLIMATPARDVVLRDAFCFANGKDSEDDSDSDSEGGGGGGFTFFSTSDGNDVVFGITDRVKKATAAKLAKTAKFDSLAMLTFALLENDTWVRDNEAWEDGDEMQSACKKLAAAWKKLLGGNTDEDLGIDEEFTKPGVLAMLEDFETILAEQGEETGVKYPFKWRP